MSSWFTADSNSTRCYFSLRHSEAAALVRFTQLLSCVLSGWAGDDSALICHVSTAQLSIPDSQSLGSGGFPTPQPTDLDLREELRELRTLILAQSREMERLARLVETNVGLKTRLDVQLDDVATTVTGSLSTLSSTSQSLVA